MSHNDITGDKIASKGSTEDYRSGWDRIFSKNKSTSETELRAQEYIQGTLSSAEHEVQVLKTPVTI